jgi:hypothetical protein
MPPFWIPVLPLAPPWFTVQAVSPITTLTRSNGTSSSSATISIRPHHRTIGHAP